MTSDSSRVSELTRALLLGASLGGAGLLAVGCAPSPDVAAQTDEAAAQALCEQALASGDRRDVEKLLRTYPFSRCLNPTLSALPAQTLASVSPSVLASVPDPVRKRIPPRPAGLLRFPQQGNSGGGDSGSGY